MAVDRRSVLVSIGMLGVFLAGAVTGVVGAAGFLHHHLRSLHGGGPHSLQRLGLTWMDWELDLTPQQEDAIDEILIDVHMDLFRFKSAHSDELEAIIDAGLDRIDAELTPDQLAAWEPTRDRIAEHAAKTIEDVMPGEGRATGDAD